MNLRAGQLWADRLADLQLLREKRWFGPLPGGERDVWLFLGACALAWMAPAAAVRREVVELGRQAIGGAWSDRAVLSDMGTVLRRALAAGAGERITWDGVVVDPRYRFRTRTILEWLSISPDEQREMRTLFGDTERARRRDAHRAERRLRGGLVRGAQRRDAARERYSSIRLLMAQGHSQVDIARRLGVSDRTVRSTLRIYSDDPEAR